MFKYGKSFAGKDPALMEWDVFRSTLDLVPELLQSGLNGFSKGDESGESINGGINGGIRKAIVDNSGIDVAQLVAITGTSRRTVERVLAKLKQQGVIEYRGSKKTGGYYIKPEGART